MKIRARVFFKSGVRTSASQRRRAGILCEAIGGRASSTERRDEQTGTLRIDRQGGRRRRAGRRGVEALALRWFADMRDGKINRSELSPEYDAHLTDHAVEHMSRHLKRYDFGHLPLEAHVLQTRESGSQTFHVVKIHFPRGDAASVLMGFNQESKITGLSLMSMAGD
jgi:hypothetical protein